MKSKSSLLLALTIISLLPLVANHSVVTKASIGIHEDFPHARVVVTQVVDGDTIYISPPVYVAGEYRSVVRLADIDAPDVSTPAGQQSRAQLLSKIAQYGGVVYLDIDKARGVDDYGRIIAVVYARKNNTHLLNLNKWMADNGYATIRDYTDNDFDPLQWTLYVGYPVEYEKLPTITRIELATTDQGIAYATSWGVKVAVTPDGNYVGIAFSEYGSWHLHVLILDKYGNIVRNVNLSDYAVTMNLTNVTDVFRGMLSIAGNNTGFLVIWNQYNATIGAGSPRSRITLYTYIPIDPNIPIPYNTSINQWFYLYNGTYQYHPHVTWYCDESGCYWIIGYHYISTTTNGRVFAYALAPDLQTRIPATGQAVILSSQRANTAGTGVSIGIDALSGILYDPATKSFLWVSRNYTDTTGYDLEVVRGTVDINTNTLNISRIPVNDTAGDVGPNATVYNSTVSGTIYYFSYNDVYPMHSALLKTGKYLLTVYNATTSSIAYAIVNLESGNVTSKILYDYGQDITFYPWIAGGESEWLLLYSAGEYINASIIKPDGSTSVLIPLSTTNSGYVRAVYDSVYKLYPVVYGVKDLVTGNYSIYLDIYNPATSTLGKYIVPIATGGDVSRIPIYAVTIPVTKSILVLAVEANNLVAYIIPGDYALSQIPGTVPTPTTTPTQTQTPTPTPTPAPILTTTTPTPTTVTSTTTSTVTLTVTETITQTRIETTTVIAIFKTTTTLVETTTVEYTKTSTATTTAATTVTTTETLVTSSTITRIITERTTETSILPSTITSISIVVAPDIGLTIGAGVVGLVVGVALMYLVSKRLPTKT